MNYNFLPSIYARLSNEDPYELSRIVFPSNIFINMEVFWCNTISHSVMRLSLDIKHHLKHLKILLFQRKYKISQHILWSKFVKLVDISDRIRLSMHHGNCFHSKKSQLRDCSLGLNPRI